MSDNAVRSNTRAGCAERTRHSIPRTTVACGPQVPACRWGTRPRKNYESHIDASLSRQPLVKGERLVRYEVNAVMAVQRFSFPRSSRMRNNCHVRSAVRLRSPRCHTGTAPRARRWHGSHFGAARAALAWCAAAPSDGELLPRTVPVGPRPT